MTDAHFFHILYTERKAERYRIKECLIILFSKNGSIICFKRERKTGLYQSADRQQHPASNGRFLANVFTQRQKDALFIQDYDLH